MNLLLCLMLILSPFVPTTPQGPAMSLLDSLLTGQKADTILQHYPAVSFDTPAFRQLVIAAEAVASGGPAAFSQNTLTVGQDHYALGRFTTPSIAELKARLPRQAAPQALKLSILLGASVFTDIQYLEAHADGDTVFQLASQFNGLEAPSASLVPVADYFGDRTQGPLGVLPAFQGALLRHYAAPAPDGTRFTQTNSLQLNFLADVLSADLGRMQSGYLTSQHIQQPEALAQKLTADFDKIRIGLHRDLPVIGYHSSVDQVLTSTLAGGSYSRTDTRIEPWLNIQRQLLRAAYLGTLLAAADAGKGKVLLTAIGGGVFHNPHPLIWESLLWALDEAKPRLKAPLHVILNLRSFEVAPEVLSKAAQERGGVLVRF